MTTRKHRKRQNLCPICGELRREPGLPLTVPFGIPTYWSPAEALAVFEFIDEMRDMIATIYGPQLTDAARQQYQPSSTELALASEDERPF